ncbi:MAG: ATP phosphoribosyltransferase [Actinobacteria bacterium]|nr:ATP phosphoribosyltransferase [Actinomycetota bacterium]
MKSLRIALCRGAIFEDTARLLEAVGFDLSDVRANSRRLIFDTADGTRFITTRPTDVPTYVENGAADVGFVGKDVLLESRKSVYEVLDLKIGYCRMVFATPEGEDRSMETLRHLGTFRVATKYPNVTRDYFQERGINPEVIKLHGSIELAPLVGLAEGIVDLTSTGTTMRENNLQERFCLHECTARLVVNRVSHKLLAAQVSELTGRLREVVEACQP